MGISILALKKL